MLIISESSDKLAMSIAGNSIVGVMLFGIIIGDFEVMGRLSVLTYDSKYHFACIRYFESKNIRQKHIYVLSTWLCTAIQIAILLIFCLGDPTRSI